MNFKFKLEALMVWVDVPTCSCLCHNYVMLNFFFSEDTRARCVIFVCTSSHSQIFQSCLFHFKFLHKRIKRLLKKKKKWRKCQPCSEMGSSIIFQLCFWMKTTNWQIRTPSVKYLVNKARTTSSLCEPQQRDIRPCLGKNEWMPIKLKQRLSFPKRKFGRILTVDFYLSGTTGLGAIPYQSLTRFI